MNNFIKNKLRVDLGYYHTNSKTSNFKVDIEEHTDSYVVIDNIFQSVG